MGPTSIHHQEPTEADMSTPRNMDHQYFIEAAAIWAAYFSKQISMIVRDAMLGRLRAGASAIDDLA